MLWLSGVKAMGGVKSLRKNNEPYKIYKRDSTESNKDVYCNMRAKVKKEIRLAKSLFERQISENAKGNPKCFVQYYSMKRKIKEEVRCIKNSKGELLYNDIAEALNGYFVESFTKEEINNTPEGIHNNLNVLANIETEDKEILDKLNELKTNKAAGPDGIFPRVLKELSEIIFKPLASIFRQSLENTR